MSIHKPDRWPTGFQRLNVAPTLITEFGTKIWYHGNMRHRYNGPAVIYGKGDSRFGYDQWYFHGRLLVENEYKNILMQHRIHVDTMTDDDVLFIELNLKKTITDKVGLG